MTAAPETIVVTERGIVRYGFVCGLTGVMLGLFLYGLALSRTTICPAVSAPGPMTTGGASLALDAGRR